MKYYDFEKAKKIIEIEKNQGLVNAEMGMLEDWFWTAETVWTKTESYSENFINKKIAGIDYSFWATPILELFYEDGSSKQLEMFFSDDNVIKK